MKRISVVELKQLELLILKDVSDFCDSHDIRFYLAYGTMLGAIRHHGFIPWDDDIDIMMPRNDYERFISIYNKPNSRYVVRSIDNSDNYYYTMAKVYDKKTYLIDCTRVKQSTDSGVFIDIFPIDGIPNEIKKQNIIFKRQQLLNLLVHGSSMKYTVSRRYIDYTGKYRRFLSIIRTILKFGAITIMRPLPTRKFIKMINKNASIYDFENSDLVSVLVDCTQFNRKEKLLKEKILPRKKYFFEGYEFWGPEDYDYYLTNMYDDYMKMPPKENRKPHHYFEAYWSD